ncbi:MAG TPA: FecR domain-containing protein [Pseudosphingobacterium sp.]|nr:FecR domain-containing protein [Pseudosphingobacterium sp.]
MDKKEVDELLDKYIKGTCTTEEKILLESLYDKVLKKQSGGPQRIDYEAIKVSIYEKLPKPKSRQIRRFLPYAAAAFVLLCISAIAIFYIGKNGEPSLRQPHAITPGSNIVTLTLSNGKKIALDDSAREELAKQAGVRIIKSNNGQLIYSVYEKDEDEGPVGFNIAETPKGGQYQVRLSDGTIVWLNASSALRFPVKFVGNERIVELTGEAYFDVSHDTAKPFIVKTASEQVQVLGTQFNLNSYHDEPAVITTLVEGSIKVLSTRLGRTSLLKPGEQSLLSGNQFSVKEANVEQAVAWKNGYFRFYDEKIESIMRTLERWYNIEEVEYLGKPSDELFTGKISRFKSITQVLKMLEKTGGAHFKIEGRRVIVMP